MTLASGRAASDEQPERPPFLDNPRADRVRRVSGLAGRSVRERRGLLLAEGPQAVRELVRHRAPLLRDVYLTDGAANRHPEILREARAATHWVHTVSEDVAMAMSPKAQGVVAVAGLDAVGGAVPGPADTPLATPDRGSGDVPDRGRPGAVAVLVEAQDPGNAGTVIRTADAMGAVGVILTHGSVDVRAPKVIRSSAGSVFRLPIVTDLPVAALVEALRARECVLLGTSGSQGSVALDDLMADGLRGSPSALSGPHAWILGNEAQGLPAEVEDRCDVLVRIPMSGGTESLNVAAAAAMCLFASQTVRART